MAKTDYERYIRTDELFACMKPLSELRAQGELLFQATHQAAELWMQVILHDLRSAADAIDDDRLARGTGLLHRSAMIERLLTQQLEILEHLPPAEYAAIREGLGKGSGQESPGFNQLLEMGELLWPAVERFLARRQLTIVEILTDPTNLAAEHALIWALQDVDAQFRTWRFAHFRLVEREIGAFVDSLKGVPAELLAQGLREHQMPELWAAVNEYTQKLKMKAAEAAGQEPAPNDPPT